jgi:hypothetical protein
MAHDRMGAGRVSRTIVGVNQVASPTGTATSQVLVFLEGLSRQMDPALPLT